MIIIAYAVAGIITNFQNELTINWVRTAMNVIKYIGTILLVIFSLLALESCTTHKLSEGSPPTSIEFNLSQKDTVAIDVYDVNGNIVEQMFNGELEAGWHKPKGDLSKLKSGVYFITVVAHKERILLKKVIILK
jgi:hypothetical protein